MHELITPEEQTIVVQRLLASLVKLRDLKIEPTRWLWPHLLMENGFHVLTGEPGSLKSLLALNIAIGLSAGKLFDEVVEPRPVIYVDKENSKNIVVDRAMRLGLEDEERLFYWGGWDETPPPHAGHEVYKLLAKELKPIMIFDSLIRFADGKDENDASQMGYIMNRFKDLRDLGATVILIHHKGKPRLEGPSTPYRGSSEIHAACDVGLTVNKKKEETGWLLTVESFKSRGEEEKTVRFHFNSDLFQFTAEEVGIASSEDISMINYFITRIPGLTAQQLATRCKMNQKKLTETLRTLDGKEWRSEDGPKNKVLYYPIENKGDAGDGD